MSRRSYRYWGDVRRNLGAIHGWLDEGRTADEVGALLARRGVDVPAHAVALYATCYAERRAVAS